MTHEMFQGLEVCLVLSVSVTILCPILMYCLPNRQSVL